LTEENAEFALLVRNFAEDTPEWGTFLGSCCPLRSQKSPVEAPHSGVLRPGQTAILVRTSATSATLP